MMKIPLTALLVLGTLAALAQGRDDRLSSMTPSQLCSEITTGLANRYSVYLRCVQIVDAYFLQTNRELGCSQLKSFMNRLPASGDFSTAARLVYAVMCSDTTTGHTTKRPPTQTGPDPACGESESLRRTSRMVSSNMSRIVGGTNVPHCSYIPWQVRLLIGQNLCGGSIVSRRHILTAAHCIHFARSTREIYAIVGDLNALNREAGERVLTIESMRKHEYYNHQTHEYDVALLTVSEDIPFSDCIKPICLDKNFDFEGLTCTVSGWGKTAANQDPSMDLKMVQVEAHKGKNCDAVYDIPRPDYVASLEHNVCAGWKEGGRDSCMGDSGGPLVCLNPSTNAFVQVGVVSYGLPCALPRFPAIYADAGYFYDWIHRNM